MNTKSLGMQVGLSFATLGLPSCTIQPPDRGGVVATGISTTYRASDESRSEAGKALSFTDADRPSSLDPRDWNLGR